MTPEISGYIEQHKVSKFLNSNSVSQFDEVINTAVNQILRDRPAEPMSELAMLLLNSAGTSFPTFDCFKARRVFLADSMATQSIRIDVYCAY